MRINWLIPEPFPGAGGDTGIFRMIRYLAEFGHDCRVYVVAYNLMNDYTTDDVRQYVHKHFGESGAHYYRWEGTAADADCSFATFWPTVEHVLKLANGGRRYYLVQDFEPTFYAPGSEHARGAEETYRAGLHCVTLGPWLAKLLRREYQAAADHFDFAVDTSVYRPRPSPDEGHPRVCFYARPKTPRRAYTLGLESLALVKAKRPDVEIVFYGAEELDPPPSFQFQNRGLIEQEELAALFSSCQVGVVFSLSNPSFVSLEMMACRCAAIELASERVEGVLKHGEDAWLVEPNAQSVADGILQLVENRSLRERLVINAYERTRGMDWRDSARQIEAILRRDAAAP